MDGFRNQSVLGVNSWNTRYKKLRVDRSNKSSTIWNLVSLNFTVEC